MSQKPTAEELAKRRFMAINMVRLSGVVLVLIGLLIGTGKIDLPRMVAVVFVLIGMFDVFFMPTVLARKWKSVDK